MTRVAFMYDFDRTLSPRDMQEYGFIDTLDMEAGDFWERATEISKNNDMDPILAYMYLMVKESNSRGISIQREGLNKLGKNVALFPGVKEWFGRMNAYALELGLEAEHYIISSGLKEIIEGTEIHKEFKEVYAS